jgi:predicted nucleic acid-binding protein
MRQLVVQRQSSFSGDRKVGFDTNVLVAVIDKPIMQSDKIDYMFSKGLFYVHQLVKNETINRLRKPPFNKTYTKEKVEKFINKKNMILLKKIPAYEHPTLKFLIQKCKENSIVIENRDLADLQIVADYLANGINRVFSGDGKMVKMCKAVGIDAEFFWKLKFTEQQKEDVKTALQQLHHK